MEEKWRIRQRILSANLEPTAKVVGVAVLEFRNRHTAECYPAHATIAKACAISVPTVKRAIAKLKAYGVIETKRTGKSCSYAFPELAAHVYTGICSSTGELSDRSTGELSGKQQESIFAPTVGENLEMKE